MIVLIGLSCKPNTPIDVAQMDLYWTYKYEDSPEPLSLVNTVPIIVNTQSVIFSTDGNVVSIDLNSGNKIWTYNLPERVEVSTSKFIFDEENFYLKYKRDLRAISLDINSGILNWEVTNSNHFYDLIHDALDDEYIYFGGKNQHIYIYSKSGDFERLMNIERNARAVAVDDRQIIYSEGWKESGAEYASGRIVALDKISGKENWSYETNNNGGFYQAELAIKDGKVYSGTISGPGEFVVLDVNSGELIWRKNIMTWSYVLTDSTVYINDGESVTALDITNGLQLWTRNMQSGFSQANVAYYDGYVYHSHGSGFNVIEAETGEIVHHIEAAPDESPFGNIVVSNERVLIQSDFYIYCFASYRL